jgi:hypothetical protein
MSTTSRHLILLASLLVLALACVPAAHAGVQVSMSSSSGLGVTTDVADKDDNIQINAVLTPEGAVGNWDVDPFCIEGNILDPFGNFCVDENDSDCSAISSRGRRVIRCSRTGAGVSVSTRGGDDALFLGTRGDAVSIDTSSGNDLVLRRRRVDNEPVESSSGTWNATLGSGSDGYTGSDGQDFLNAGTGNDTIDTGDGSDSVTAGDGTDVVNAGPESQKNDADGYDGGDGFDTLDWSGRSTGVFVALIGTTGGAPTENDGIANFEKMIGSSGDDSFLGFDSEGRGGNDTLTGSNGADKIVGGAGADVMRGFGGDDVIDANDGVADTRISCSTGTDTVKLDLKDPNPDDAAACESITRVAVNEEPSTEIASPSAKLSGATVAIRVRCPKTVKRAKGCAGALTAALAKSGASRPAKTAYSVKPGATATVKAILTAAEVARVNRSGQTLVATLAEKGLKGAETVIRRVVLTR